MRYLLCVVFLFAQACAWSNGYGFPGGLATLNVSKKSNKLPIVKYGTREPAIVDKGDQWRVYIGLGLDHLPGEYLVYFRDQEPESEATFYRFFVKQIKFLTKQARDDDESIPKLPNDLSDLDFKNTTPLSLPFSLPIDAEWEDGFGNYLLRTTSDIVRQQDFVRVDVAENIEIKSPSTGIISKITHSKETGKYTLVIDHGSGLFSIFNGLGSVSMKLGHGLSAGEVFGHSPSKPKTGERKSKPRTAIRHTISWRTQLNNELINPLILTVTE